MSTKETVLKTVARGATRVGFGALSRYRQYTSSLPDDPDRPWFHEYAVFDVPETLEPYPEVPLHQFLVETADEHSEEGLIQRGRTVTYPEVLADAERLATAFADMGIEKGDRVATILPTSVQFVVVDSAISMAGGIHVPNDFLDATEDLEYRLEKSDSEILVGHDRHEDLLFELADRVGFDEVVLTNIDDYSADPPSHDDRERVTWLTDLIDEYERDPPSISFDPETDVHTLLFTGGTTGQPKGCQLTHRNLVANVLQSNSLAGSSGLTSTTLLAQPMYHAYGYTATHSRIESGNSVALVDDPRDVDRMRALIDEHGIRLVSGVPTQIMELLDEDVGRNLIALSGSAPLANEVRDEFESDHLGISQGYGLSEMSPVTHADLRGLIDSISGTQTTDDRFDHPSIGIPVPDTEIKLIDVDSGDEIPIHEAVEEGLEGEMYLDGPQRMLGYLDRPDPFDEDGFIATGDVVKIDATGRFYVVDRVKNMVNVSGLKVYTEEVDEVLYELEAVRRPATIGVPDPERPGSERVKIYVEPEPDASLEPEDVREHLEGRVPKQAMPKEVEVVDEIPLTAVGKINKQELKERAEQEIEQ
ncbi:AMP-binding protein [Natrarchaeobaculum aegyptiacum]|uniref:AMP-binding protein n=1 Tax=Natrarchaeobaculum aegyptiacum TaxID=745377 RepID=UPI000A3D7865|nr:AMP-binding protein [Natrarchaeobaculum aegyptiacum]